MPIRPSCLPIVFLILLAGNSAMAAVPEGCVDVRDPSFGAKGDGTSDDSPAFAAAIDRVNTLRKDGSRVGLCVPPGYYRLAKRTLPVFLYGGLVIGTYHQSIVQIDPSYKGDVFSWSEAWEHGSSYSAASLPLSAVSERAGPGAIGLVVTGSPVSPNLQNGFSFYDRNDLILMRDVEIRGMHGRGIVLGITKARAIAYARESNFFNLYLSYCGAILSDASLTGDTILGSATVINVRLARGLAVGQTIAGPGIPDGAVIAAVRPGAVELSEAATTTGTAAKLTAWTDLPAVEIDAEGTGDSSNQMNFFAINVLESAGRGVVIRNLNPNKRIGQIRFYGLRIEGGSYGRGDQLQLGDTGQAYTGGVSDVLVQGFVSNASAPGFSSLAIYASSQHGQPYGVTVQGQIPTGKGVGINVQAGRLLRFQMQDMGTKGVDLVVGRAPLVGPAIVVDGNTIEDKWTEMIDPSSQRFVVSPSYTPVHHNERDTTRR